MIYDVIVIGGGHAGCESAAAAAKMGCQVLLLTLNIANIAAMPCNPSIGGPAKGHLVREIDALGGIMGRLADRTYLQMRMLNTQKGPAVWALRSQADKFLYQREMLKYLESFPNIQIRQAEITELLFNTKQEITGVRSQTGLEFAGRTVIIATGTFLGGKVFIGQTHFPSGPMGQLPANELADYLKNRLGIPLGRFKTGTPARVRRRSLDFTKMTPQSGGYQAHGFSFWQQLEQRPEEKCWLTFTNEKTHQIIKDNMHEAALFSGYITGVGPRYCPSIEGKIAQFPHKEQHQIFVEPESIDTDEMYLAGLSSSLSEKVQKEFLQTIPGFEKIEIVRPAYAIEYDVIPSEYLKPSLELRAYSGLFAAGQINGSSGYEEAAAQGLLAGINAVLKLREEEPLVFKRSEGYMGVLIDDLVTKENYEPYRLLTSRAEYRLSLRADSADERLTPYGIKYGLISTAETAIFNEKRTKIKQAMQFFVDTFFTPNAEIQALFQRHNLAFPKNRFSLADLLKRPEISLDFLKELSPNCEFEVAIVNEAATQIRYQTYIQKEAEQVARLQELEERKIPFNLDYDQIANLASEAKEKLKRFQPTTFAQATRISGINPADLTALLFYLENQIRKR